MYIRHLLCVLVQEVSTLPSAYFFVDSPFRLYNIEIPAVSSVIRSAAIISISTSRKMKVGRFLRRTVSTAGSVAMRGCKCQPYHRYRGERQAIRDGQEKVWLPQQDIGKVREVHGDGSMGVA